VSALQYALRLRAGPVSGLPTLAARELAATNDARRLLFGDGTTNYVMAVQHNIAATTNPGTGDDSADGYSVGSIWVNTSTDTGYLCKDATAGAAVWDQIGTSSGAGDLPTGGTAGQVLVKQSGTDYDADWEDPASSGTVPNVLHNGGFEVWQRGTTTAGNDDTYTADRWYQLTETATGGASRQTGTQGARYAGRFQNTAGGTQRIGAATIVEASDSIPYRGRSVRFQFKASASTSTAIRFAILEWTGTADSVTSDVVNTWSSGTYTAGNFFLGANLTVVAVGSGTATTSFTSFNVTGTVSSSCNNLIVFVWTESAIAISGTFTLTECGLYDGTDARDWLPRSVAEELAICQRYLYARASDTIGIALNSNNMYSGGVERFPVEMRAAPTQSGATFSVNAGSAGTPSFANTSGGFTVTNSASNWTATAIVTLNSAVFSAEL
jgi:hypothetical protein